MKAALIVFAVLSALSTGCTYYETAPGQYVAAPYVAAPPPASPSRFDRSWSAAVGAFEDQGVRIATEDRSAGGVCAGRGTPST